MSNRQLGFYPFRGPVASCTQIGMLQAPGPASSLRRVTGPWLVPVVFTHSLGGRPVDTTSPYESSR